ncbi:MAG TPA: MBL fold metallo-hydrolase [Vicinamibacterales bacterium]|nr:MBL fold metallo-hydrolase [Vicinamibacterales bacterium]
MRVRFWGVRGSVPWALPSAIGHGCNTPCLEVSDEKTGETLILDAGSGIVGAGEALASHADRLPILLTHYHWDHLQGLPFFAPLYRTGAELTIFAPALGTRERELLPTLFESPFFPVPYSHLPNRPAIEHVQPGACTIGSFEIDALPLNHPGGALAYRIRGVTGDLVYATDHEFGDPAFDEPLAAFVRGAAVLVADAHFTPPELPQRRGWGHGTWRQCAEFAAATDVGGLWLFHHKPGRTDQELVRIRSDARRVFPATETATEGERLQL